MVKLEGLIEYTDVELEQKAHEYLFRARQDVQFKIPVNVEALLQGCPSVGDIDTVTDLLKGTRHEGVICRHMNGRDLKVFLDEYTADHGPRASYYAVVGEELAHVVLHEAILIQVKSLNEFMEVQKSPQWHRIERDARRFSAAIRMPFKHVILSAEGLYRDIVSEHGFGDTWTIQKLLRNALAEKFVVPPEDMHKRLMQWPCAIYERANISIQGKLGRLAHEDSTVHVDPPKQQKKLFGNELE